MPYPMTIPQYSMLPTMMAKGGQVNNARSVRAQGRGNDTMLVHMTPREVGGLQALARARGGSLTINPQTGLPEAGFLDDFFPTLAGLALTVGSGGAIDPVTAGMIVGGGTAAATGDLQQGLLAGLGAYGGAGTGAGLSAAGAATGKTAASSMLGVPEALGGAASGAGSQAAMLAAENAAMGLTPAESLANIGSSAGYASQAAVPSAITASLGQAGQGLQNVLSSGPTGQAARSAFMKEVGGPTGLAKNIGGISAEKAFETPTYDIPEEEEEKYEGPYTPSKRTVRYPDASQRRSTSEFSYFTPSNPVPFAEGGNVGSTSLGSMSAPEARVFSQIANVQRLAGLPALDTSGFTVRPPIDRSGLVYNPIEGGTEGGIGPLIGNEIDYGFQSLSSDIPQGGMPQTTAGPQSVTFYRPILNKRFSSPFVNPQADPDAYREKYESYVPTSNVNMFLYEYDPILGGYKERPLASENAKGGLIQQVSAPQLESGGFVLTKKAVDGLGDGDNERGQEVASRGLGAIPIKGPGTGTSDSIKTTIDGKQPARIANGESYVPRKEVQKRGGAKKFYALMKKAERRA